MSQFDDSCEVCGESAASCECYCEECGWIYTSCDCDNFTYNDEETSIGTLANWQSEELRSM